jgi:hypothetical protein
MCERKDQQVHVDLPMRANLNKKEMVKGLAMGVLKLQELSLECSSDVSTEEAAPCMEDLEVYCGGGGAPSHTIDALAAENSEKVALKHPCVLPLSVRVLGLQHVHCDPGMASLILIFCLRVIFCKL